MAAQTNSVESPAVFIGGQGRLSALPSFMRDESLWAGLLSPKVYLDNQRYADVRHYTASHRWSITSASTTNPGPEGNSKIIIEVALALLQRGAWANCSWFFEQQLAKLWQEAELADLLERPQQRGLLGYELALTSQGKKSLSEGLISGLLQAEVQSDSSDALWNQLCHDLPAFEHGSVAEKAFFDNVLVPTLGFPLLHYVRAQTPLSDLIEQSDRFVKQRVDFSIQTGRGLKLVIEIDGSTHHDSNSTQVWLDKQRTQALMAAGWDVWRPTGKQVFGAPEALCQHLRTILMPVQNKRKSWALDFGQRPPRSVTVMSAVWGATVAARAQFLMLTAWQQGILPSDRPWRIAFDEDGTCVAPWVLADLNDWLNRLFELYDLPKLPEIDLVQAQDDSADLLISLSCRNPWHIPSPSSTSVAHSCPVNQLLTEPTVQFSGRVYCPFSPSQDILARFAQDLFRKPTFREGQYEILSRIMTGQDVVGLLPTGGGKSLTYQLASMLLPGATLYVAPLKSLLQDQYERLVADGIDACAFVSSALDTQQRVQQEARFASGQLRMLMVAPERFLIEGFRTLLDSYQALHGKINQVVVDECHCVSEWGHEFRPAYLSLSRIVKDRTTQLDAAAPIVALTGTASTDVLEDVCRELGVLDKGAVRRAKRLDRPELELLFHSVMAANKPRELAKVVNSCVAKYSEPTSGLLVFCPHVTGDIGVINVFGYLTTLCKLAQGSAIRFYSGAIPSRYEGDKKVEFLPAWAVQSGKALKERWEATKTKLQRDFISGRDGNFQVLVATSAFGMGIDKPSIRNVIHYIAPLSPEAYYQEVGRAARDGLPATAHLLFSDEMGAVTDQVLNPGLDINDAALISQGLKGKKNIGDFLKTFWKMSNRYLGVETESGNLLWAWQAIAKRTAAAKSNVLVLQFKNYTPGAAGPTTTPDGESSLEYSLVRLMHLGVVDSYTKGFHTKTFSITCSNCWLDARHDFQAYQNLLVSALDAYLKRYEARQATSFISPLFQVQSIDELEETAAHLAVQYLYEKIEKKRRRATRAMLEIARTGTTDPLKARRNLVLHLQASEKFSEQLLQMAREDLFGRTFNAITSEATSPAEWDELRGATGNQLTSNPDHPGLLMLSAISRRNPTPFDLDRSKEDFLAAINLLTKLDSDDSAADLAEEALSECEKIDAVLADCLIATYAQWSHEKFGIRFALEKVNKRPAGQARIWSLAMQSAQRDIPNWLN